MVCPIGANWVGGAVSGDWGRVAYVNTRVAGGDAPRFRRRRVAIRPRRVGMKGSLRRPVRWFNPKVPIEGIGRHRGRRCQRH